jgi:hypothetical protein
MLREMMAAFTGMGAAAQQLTSSAASVRLKLDDEYLLEWCSPAWMCILHVNLVNVRRQDACSM